MLPLNEHQVNSTQNKIYCREKSVWSECTKALTLMVFILCINSTSKTGEQQYFKAAHCCLCYVAVISLMLQLLLWERPNSWSCRLRRKSVASHDSR